MGQRRSLRPVRPRSRPGLLGTGPYVVFLHQSGRYPNQDHRWHLMTASVPLGLSAESCSIATQTPISFHCYSDPDSTQRGSKITNPDSVSSIEPSTMRKVIPGQRLIFTLGLVLFVMGGLAGGYEGELLSPEAVAPEGEQPPTYTPLSEFQKRHRLSNSGFLIRGRIRTLDKRPISGADVSLYDLFDWKTNRPTGLRRSTSSNEMGHYQMHIDAPFKGTLTVGKPGFAPIQEDVNLASPLDGPLPNAHRRSIQGHTHRRKTRLCTHPGRRQLGISKDLYKKLHARG